MKKKSLPASPSASDRPSRDGSLGGVVIVMLTAITILTISCSKAPTEPERRIKTPREMTWTTDTLPVPEGAIQVLPEDLLVLSPTDIYLATWVGHGVIMHYDGSKWTKVLDSGGINCLAGTAANDLWAGGYTGNPDGEVLISHYNGVQWKNVSTGVKGELLGMTQDPEGNIWACGRNGVILKYDKTKWITDTIKMKLGTDVSYWLQSIEYYNGKAYLLASTGNKITLKEEYYYIIGDFNNWVIADSMDMSLPTSIRKWGYRGLYTASYNKIYSFGLGGVWIYKQNNWVNIKNVSGAINGMYGKDENYLFAVGDFQKVLFYNGNTWESIADIFHISDPYFIFKSAWTDGYETFIVGYTFQGYPQKTIIFHGK